MLKPMVQVREQDGLLVSEFWDCLRLDPAPVQDLRKHYETHLRGGKRPDLVVDLNGVTFAGSASLGGFLALRKLAQPRGGRVIFCNVDPTVLEVFRVSRLTTLFDFAPDLPAAMVLAAAGPPPAASPPSTPSRIEPRPASGLTRRRKL